MANIALSLDPSATPFPFETFPGGALQYSAVPRGRMVFRVNDQVIAAKIATNTTSIQITNTLPANYAYVLEWFQADVILATDTAEAAQFDAVGQIQFALGDGAGTRDSQLFSEGIYATTLNAGSGRAWCALQGFPLPIFNVLGNAPAVTVRLNDSDVVNATVAGLLNATLSFLQYDLEQIFNLALNFPVPVQVR